MLCVCAAVISTVAPILQTVLLVGMVCVSVALCGMHLHTVQKACCYYAMQHMVSFVHVVTCASPMRLEAVTGEWQVL